MTLERHQVKKNNTISVVGSTLVGQLLKQYITNEFDRMQNASVMIV